MFGGSGIHDGCNRWPVRVCQTLQTLSGTRSVGGVPHCLGAMSLPCLATEEGEILIIFEL